MRDERKLLAGCIAINIYYLFFCITTSILSYDGFKNVKQGGSSKIFDLISSVSESKSKSDGDNVGNFVCSLTVGKFNFSSELAD